MFQEKKPKLILGFLSFSGNKREKKVIIIFYIMRLEYLNEWKKGFNALVVV